VEQEAALESRLPKILKGDDQPSSDAERMTLAAMCQHKKRYAAVRFYAEGFAARPDPFSGYRYSAAHAAARAGCGQGVDAAQLDAAERARLLRQALEWLRAYVTASQQYIDKQPSTDFNLQLRVTHISDWLADPEFDCVRGSEALAKLPETERQAWQQLWNDLADKLKEAQRKAGPEKK